VPPSWLQQSWTARTRTSWNQDYGFLWYLERPVSPAYSAGTPSAAGLGNGGQRLFVLPEARLACVILAGRYDQPGAEQIPERIWRRAVLPSLVGS
jgi:CubicO group peptidase (beta-lactamase class C family)